MASVSYFPGDPDKPEVPTGPKLDELAGLGPARDWGERIAADIRNCMAGTLSWDHIDPGALISGPPGTGKTTFVKALAATLGIRLIETSYDRWNSRSSNGNDIAAAINADFDRANANAPCIIFIDEIDSIPSRSIDNHNTTYFTPINNTLLKRLERRNLKPGVIVIAATNHPERVDDAIKRSGRLDRHLKIKLPRAKDLEEILAYHLKQHVYGIGDLSSIAVLCVGKSGADIEKLVRDACRIARHASRLVTRHDLITVIEQDAPKLRPKELERSAYHEAGHAAAVYRLKMSDDITLSLVAPDGAGGVMRAPLKTKLLTEFHVVCRLIALLAGRAAEERFCDDISSGSGGPAESDIAQATELAIRAYDELALRSIWHGPTARRGAPAPDDVVREARRLLDKAYEAALELMDMDHEFIRRIAKALVEKRALAHDDLVALDPGPPHLGHELPTEPPARQPPQQPHRHRPLPPPHNDNDTPMPQSYERHPARPPYGDAHAPPHWHHPPYNPVPTSPYDQPPHHPAYTPWNSTPAIPDDLRTQYPPGLPPAFIRSNRAAPDNDNDEATERDTSFSGILRDAFERIYRRRN